MNEMSIEELKEAVTYSDMDTEAKAEVFEILSLKIPDDCN